MPIIQTIIIVALLSMTLTGCFKIKHTVNEQVESPVTELNTEISANTTDKNMPEGGLVDFPRVDGSTATIPLSEQLLADYRGVSLDEARLEVLHNKTNRAYRRLIHSEADIIFVTAPSEDELRMAEKAGIELEIYPIVNEGFVFLVNKQNPLSNLTQEQILGIYSGTFTNWSEVGGEDKPIIPYQRPVNSGSQSGMLSIVMKDTPLMNAPADYYMSEMNELVRAVAEYENTEQAIGYSYYYYVNSMYVKSEVRLLAIDGVVPDEETIKNGTYPYTTAYYAVIRASEPEGNHVRNYLDWILREGQDSAVKAGYVPLPKPAISESLGVQKDTNYSYHNGIEFNHSFYDKELEKVQKVKISGLKDQSVQNKVNQRIQQAMDEIIQSGYPAYRGINQILNHDGNDRIKYSVDLYYNQSNVLSVMIEKNYSYYNVNDQITLNFNLVTGEEITFADLFYKGYDYQNIISDYVNKNVADGLSPDIQECMLYPLETIEADQKFVISKSGNVRLVFDYKNPEFDVGWCFVEVPLRADLMPEGGEELQFSYQYETWDDSLLEPGRNRKKMLKNQPYESVRKSWIINPSVYFRKEENPSAGFIKEDERFATEVYFETAIVKHIENETLAAQVTDMAGGIQEHFLEIYQSNDHYVGQGSTSYRVEILGGYLLECEIFALLNFEQTNIIGRYYRVSDIHTGKQLLLADCFKAGVDYKKLLAEYIEVEIPDDCQFTLLEECFLIMPDDGTSSYYYVYYENLGNDNLTIFKEYPDS